jgi:hypothetical protein
MKQKKERKDLVAKASAIKQHYQKKESWMLKYQQETEVDYTQ